jgi:hypothetical protein
MVYIAKALREFVHQRAKGKGNCEYCQTPEKYVGLPHEVDHIVPQSVGGETVAENLALACGVCNSHKSNAQNAKDPESGELVSLFNPRQDVWKEHFAWSEDKLRVVALSAKGRVGVERLKMNNALILSARQVWLKAGWIAVSD